MSSQRVTLYLDQLDYDRLLGIAAQNHMSVPVQAAKLLQSGIRTNRMLTSRTEPVGPVPPPAPEDEAQAATGILHVSTMFGYKNRQPKVILTYDAPGQEFHVQLSIAAALNHAQDVNEVAASAVADAFLVNWLAETVHLADEQAAQLLGEFRVWREAHRE